MTMRRGFCLPAPRRSRLLTRQFIAAAEPLPNINRKRNRSENEHKMRAIFRRMGRPFRQRSFWRDDQVLGVKGGGHTIAGRIAEAAPDPLRARSFAKLRMARQRKDSETTTSLQLTKATASHRDAAVHQPEIERAALVPARPAVRPAATVAAATARTAPIPPSTATATATAAASRWS
jgi:hypothetical protein